MKASFKTNELCSKKKDEFKNVRNTNSKVKRCKVILDIQTIQYFEQGIRFAFINEHVLLNYISSDKQYASSIHKIKSWQ